MLLRCESLEPPCLSGVNRVGGSHGRPTLSVRSTPNSDRKLRGLASVAKCHVRTSCTATNGPLIR